MASKWMTIPLSELTASPITYGVVQPGSDTPDGFPMLRVNNFQGHILNLSQVMKIAPEIEAKYERTRIRYGDVLLTIVGSVGQVAVVPKQLNGWNIARAIAMIRPKGPELSRWISLVLRSPLAQYQLNVAANTTVQTTINLKDLRELPIPLPEKNERDAIVHILGTLDDKIELNRQMNETLEAMARALFKSWFVDFDPVRAKKDGRWKRGQSLPGLPAHLFDLFPSEFEDSELGLVPKGWSVSRLGDCELEVESGRRPKGGIDKYLKSGTPSIGAESIQSPIGSFDYSSVKYVTTEYSNKSKKGWIQNFDVMLYKDGGKPGEFKPRVTLYGEEFPFEKAMINEHIFILRSALLGQFYLYRLITSEFVLDQLIARGSSKAAQPGLNQEEVNDTTFVQPSKNLLEAYNELAKPMAISQLNKGKEINCLLQIRDTLLPVLINGQILLKNAENIMESHL